ncbi:TPA: GNAT family N-acetyltransferase [Legionella pneumophila]|uniref:GNAT family N-acetyltransferase n=1 Tax=Legionella pneumophila TaxID=446 RepID=UPI001374BA57|nr:GNAT family N-acetyltransferase [Legionella pneumophila]HAT9703084.1 GNAT family N-acetyltransferase [Legionella pneumophila subsp. pneumophila]MDI0469823.1 GNAT family N-acetyltransferase [Legionella pneumophila]HAT8742753.1 GNAT family N-acetyltransferase [Legionella pneumophila]HAU1444119.1 GNAT family N-acetyltransferase [Legionella pneumophila]HBI2978870.1 GNAT family N-acetyltransferase [Legionella pneumophila]
MIFLRKPSIQDETVFIAAMKKSRGFHFPFITAPTTTEEFQLYLNKGDQESEQYYFAWNDDQQIIGVFNISGIMRGVFKSAYLGYYATEESAGKGLMSQALKLVLKEIFTTLDLHRIEANIQPTNTASIQLAKKNGFIKEGFSPRYLKINGIWQDHFRFALTFEDWLANQ